MSRAKLIISFASSGILSFDILLDVYGTFHVHVLGDLDASYPHLVA